MQVRTRFAPSPTGYLHLGGLRTALYTWLFTRKNNGRFILRIEDTDTEREVPGATEKIYSSMKAAGLNWDEGPLAGGDYGPYIQSERKGIYKQYALELVEKGAAYYCFCTKEELDARRAAAAAEGRTFKYDKHCLHMDKAEVQRRLDAGEEWVIRQNIPEEGKAGFDDLLHGHIEVNCSELDDNVLLKSDGMPTYNFANVIDDHLMGITHILRGMEYLSSTPKYNLLYEAFGWDIPQYVHLPPVMRDATTKLSKRLGDPSFEDLLDKGYLKEAIINYIALLGWNPGTNQEFFTMDELIEAFSLERISTSPAIFDNDKLNWFNAHYITELPDDKFIDMATPWLGKTLDIEKFDIPRICSLVKTRISRLDELPAMVDFLAETLPYDTDMYTHKKMKTNPEISLASLQASLEMLEAEDDWCEEALHASLMGLVEKLGIKNGQLLWPLRTALSGKQSTPGGATEILYLLGKDESLARIKAGIEKIKASL